MQSGGPQGDAGSDEEPGGFEAFFRAYFAAVARSSALVVHDFSEGEEIAQESFARLLLRWDRMQSADHARNFVFKVAINLSRSHLRKTKRISRDEPGIVEDVPAGRESNRAEDRMMIEEALESLSPRQRAALVLVDYAGYDAATVAKMLKTRPSTVRVHLARARAALGTRLEEAYRGTGE